VIDALGRPQTLLLLGGTSEIGGAIARRLAEDGLAHAILASRRPAVEAADALRRGGVAQVTLLELDLSRPDAAGELRRAVASLGVDIDVIVDAIGVLGADVAVGGGPGLAHEVATSGFSGHVPVLLELADLMRIQGHGTVVVLSSFAAVRPRASLLAYSPAKAGLDAFATALGDALDGSGPRVMIVRPGFVRTRMTDGLPAPPFTVAAEAVAAAVAAGLRRRRATVWVPGWLAIAAPVTRAIPRSIWRRLPV
jgi:decaprenylphospho-beta-D-erythro-pentofuranosid-2-ulose 2-reductase